MTNASKLGYKPKDLLTIEQNIHAETILVIDNGEENSYSWH